MKKLGLWVLACGLLAVACGAQGAFPATELAILEADAWRARMGFHLLSIRGDNPQDREALSQLLAQGERRISELKGQTKVKASQVGALDEAWLKLSDRALDNPLATLGYADYGAMSEINATTLVVADLVDRAAAESKDKYLDIADLSVIMQRLASEYLALAAFPSAGLPTGTDLPPMDFAVEAKAIDDKLESLKARYASDPQATEVLEFTLQRWLFVRSAISRMNEVGAQKVPYLFYRYATQVAEHVEALVNP